MLLLVQMLYIYRTSFLPKLIDVVDNNGAYGYHAWDFKLRNLSKSLLVVRTSRLLEGCPLIKSR
jgi:hypothetical protein